jgi:hypothetical protein
MPISSGIDRTVRNSTHLGTYVFGASAERHLRRAEMLVNLHEERLVAVGEQIKQCAEVIAACKATVERVDGLLSRRSTPPKQQG